MRDCNPRASRLLRILSCKIVKQSTKNPIDQRTEYIVPVPGTGSLTPALDNTLIIRIVSEVTQAVVASVSHPNQPATTSLVEPTTTREVALGGIPVADATVQGPVASAMENLTGEHINLGGSSPHFSGMSNFNSVSVAIDAQVSPKLKAKIWANEFIDFGLLLNPQLGDTRYHLSLSASEHSVPTLSLEATTKTKHIPNVEVWASAFQVFCWGLHQ